MPRSKPDSKEAARRSIERLGGVIRTQQAHQLGIHSSIIYRLRDEGVIESLARGTWRLTSLPDSGTPDLLIIALRAPKAVLCLTSALAFHELTTTIPHAVHIALPTGARSPRIEHPPLRVFRFGPSMFQLEVEVHQVDGLPLQVYSAEKTLVDCFRFRNQIGMEIVLETLKEYRQRKKRNFQKVLEIARLARVENGLRPYLEAMT